MRSAEDEGDTLLIMLPGAGMRAADFVAHGMVDAVAQRTRSVAVRTIEPDMDAYLDGAITRQVLDEIAACVRMSGRTHVWLAGISLGCQAILNCVRAQPGVAAGLILITPYLASSGLIAEIVRAGGLQRWSVAQRGSESERALPAWLGTAPPASLPATLLGYATEDRFAATALLLSDLLPPGQVVHVAGGHDWASWRALWALALDADPFHRAAEAA